MGIEDTSNPTQTDPIRPDPIRYGPNRSGPNRSDPFRSDPVRSDPTRSNPVLSDPIRSDPIRPDPIRTDPIRSMNFSKFKCVFAPKARRTFQDYCAENAETNRGRNKNEGLVRPGILKQNKTNKTLARFGSFLKYPSECTSNVIL